MPELTRATLQTAVERAGVGLHSGRWCHARVAPAPPGHGWTLNGGAVGLAAVVDAAYATTLATPAGPVSTVEHLFAALAGCAIDDAAITVIGGEVPILDGSAAPWAAGIARCEHGGAREALRLTAPVVIQDGDRWIHALPAAALVLDVAINFPRLGAQRFAAPAADFAALAGARTFGFAADAAALAARGRALGASFDNTLVFDDDGRPLTALRWPDEPARHKWIDLLGDLALLGRPLCARVVAHKAGHGLHHRLVEALLALPPPMTRGTTGGATPSAPPRS